MTDKEIQNLLPNHVGLILDGNRRWAKEQNLPAMKGHYQGSEVLRDMVIIAINGGIKYVSAFVFSTENWNRSKSEVSYLMGLIIKFSEQYVDDFLSNDIKLVHVGSRDGLPKAVLAALDKAVIKTRDCKKGVFGLCVNYGGQQEIVDAAKRLLRHKVDPNRLSVRDFEKELYVPELPPLDLVIRTSGEMRSSGFMLWNAAYAEYIFLDKYWPDFNTQDLKQALLVYAKRQRRFGS
ncbi:MAG: polyprenyl diphosphate synthase [bacterium]|nr:polyprenyl diphosphate synthase [bacterium]